MENKLLSIIKPVQFKCSKGYVYIGCVYYVKAEGWYACTGRAFTPAEKSVLQQKARAMVAGEGTEDYVTKSGWKASYGGKVLSTASFYSLVAKWLNKDAKDLDAYQADNASNKYAALDAAKAADVAANPEKYAAQAPDLLAMNSQE